MKMRDFIFVVALALLGGFSGNLLSGAHNAVSGIAAAESKEAAFARVERTKTLRCGYLYYPPYIERKEQTGELSGFNVDLMNAIGRKLGVKIEWSEEVNNGTMMEGLNNGRYDALCIMTWQTPVRAMHAFFTVPFGFTPIYAWARAGDAALPADLAKLNDSRVRIATMDGEISDNIARSFFPKAGIVAIPQGSPYADSFMNVVTGKADVYFAEEEFASVFLSNNPGSLRKLRAGPLVVFPMTLALPLGDLKLKNAIDTAMAEIVYSPQYDQIMAPYGGAEGLKFKKPALPYVN